MFVWVPLSPSVSCASVLCCTRASWFSANCLVCCRRLELIFPIPWADLAMLKLWLFSYWENSSCCFDFFFQYWLLKSGKTLGDNKLFLRMNRFVNTAKADSLGWLTVVWAVQQQLFHTEEAKNPVVQTIKLSISAAVGAEGLEGSGELLTLVCVGIQEELALTWAKECQSNRAEQRSSTFLMLGPLPQLLMLCWPQPEACFYPCFLSVILLLLWVVLEIPVVSSGSQVTPVKRSFHSRVAAQNRWACLRVRAGRPKLLPFPCPLLRL